MILDFQGFQKFACEMKKSEKTNKINGFGLF